MAIITMISYFSERNFMPHGHCYLWNSGLLWTHAISDTLIGLAYVSITISLCLLIRKIRIPFSAMILSFGIFIGACGATHFMEVWNLWSANYWYAAIIKVLTAIASVSTGIWLIRIKPQVICLAEAAKLSEERRTLLEKTNMELRLRTEELARINTTLEEQQKILAHSAKMSALGEMASGIAHEINSPLGIITLHANQLGRSIRRNSLTPEIVLKESKLISDTAMRIGNIIKGLRAFAREGDNDPFEWTSVGSLVEDALVLCQARFKTREIELRVSDMPSDVNLECRVVQIGQVILNLLTNAYDAVQDLPIRWVSVEAVNEAEQIVISVTDSGSGIPKDSIEKIMQPFFTTKEVGKGTGLGLSISKGIIEVHNGSLAVDTSSPNTKFVVRLPRYFEKRVEP
jgi:C4-dicarboxylate-specific signal transduction histidine kinase